MYSVSLILLPTTLMLHKYLSLIPGSDTPHLHYCNKCEHGVSCWHDETFMLSHNFLGTFKWVTDALIHVRSERMKKVLNTTRHIYLIHTFYGTDVHICSSYMCIDIIM